MNKAKILVIKLFVICFLIGHIQAAKFLNFSQYHETLENDAVSICTAQNADARLVNLYNCKKITDASVIAIANNCDNLEKLNLANCSNITDQSLKYLALKGRPLRELNLCNCRKITTKSLGDIITILQNLEFLDISGCKKIPVSFLLTMILKCNNLKNLIISVDSEDQLKAFRDFAASVYNGPRINEIKDHEKTPWHPCRTLITR